MGNFEDLLGALSKLINLAFDAHLLNGVSNALNVDHPLVGEGVEQIESLDSLLPSLTIAKNQINPLVEMVRDVFGLKGSSVDFQK